MLCRRCGQVRDESEFRSRNGKIVMPCKKCYLEYGRRHYQNNKQYYVDKARRRSNAISKVYKERIWQYLLEHPCVDCGNADPRVLEFDHVRGEKKYNISELQYKRVSWEVVLAEIEKCEIRCANCHRIKTFEQFHWFTFDEAP